MNIDWSQVNALILVGILAYLWRQTRTVDSVRQALLGFDGKGGGALDEIRTLRNRTHDLANSVNTLNLTIRLATEKLEILWKKESEE